MDELKKALEWAKKENDRLRNLPLLATDGTTIVKAIYHLTWLIPLLEDTIKMYEEKEDGHTD